MPGEDVFCSSEIKHDAKNKLVCFGVEITGTMVTNLKTVLSLSPGEDAGFRDRFSDTDDTYRTIRLMTRSRAIKIYRVIQNDGLNFIRLYFLNYTLYVNDVNYI
jgi:hypothetical protein